ncbi:MAG: VWA domain-containing protein [Acidobacteriia bacterium]|nr:VWA domain-containing protein [Terriglobia bacterium]
MDPSFLEALGGALQPSGYRKVSARQPEGDLPQNMLQFCALLRKRGFMAGTAEAMEALRVLPHIDLADWRGFYLVLRSLFVSRREELNGFDALFHSFWTGWGGFEQSAHQLFETPPEHTGSPTSQNHLAEKEGTADLAPDGHNPNEETSIALYSPEEILAGRLFSRIEQDELKEMEKRIKRLSQRLATKPGRRMRVGRRGHGVDLRRSLRHSLGFGGDIVTLVRRQRRLRRLRLVLLLDVSRSMDVYSSLLLKLIYSLHNLRGKTESFVFGTNLKRVTDCFRSADINTALVNLSRQVPFWSGGTRIGHSFRLFNQKYAHKVLTTHTVLIILSDGLDTEKAEVVAEELAIMKQRVAKLIWLNPLSDTPDYEPAAASMAAALPYIDVFTSINRLLWGKSGPAAQTA